MKHLYAFARRIFGICAAVLLLLCGMYALGVPADLPGWRKILGVALFCAAAIVFETFASEEKKP